MSNLTRRELAAALSTGTLAAPGILLGQPQPAPADEMTAVRTQLHDNADQLDKFPLPMAAEPATIFKP